MVILKEKNLVENYEMVLEKKKKRALALTSTNLNTKDGTTKDTHPHPSH